MIYLNYLFINCYQHLHGDFINTDTRQGQNVILFVKIYFILISKGGGNTSVDIFGWVFPVDLFMHSDAITCDCLCARNNKLKISPTNCL